MIVKKSHDSFQILQELSVKQNFAIYGSPDSQSNRFETISLPNQKYLLGLVYYNHGIDSQILVIDDTAKLIIGFEKTIVALDYITKAEIINKETISPFYEFIKTNCYILAVFEFDIYVFDPTFNLIWSSGFRDIVVNYHVCGDEKILIECANGDKSIFALRDGSPYPIPV